jgi:hypothetical protein
MSDQTTSQIPPELLARYQAEQDRAARVAAAQLEVQAALQRHGCALEPRLTMTNAGYRLDVVIVASEG